MARRLWADGAWVDPAAGRVERGSLLEWNGRIAAFGPAAALEGRFGTPDERIDLAGRLVLPGLTDAHCHLVTFGVEETRTADLRGVRSLDNLIDRLRVYAGGSSGEWVLGRGFDQELLAERRFPHRRDLDAAFPDRPALISRVCHHAVVANSRAMQRAGVITDDGLFTEDAMAPLWRAVPPPSPAEMRDAARFAVRAYNRSGFTSADVIIGDAREIRALEDIRRRGDLTVRVRLVVPFAWIDALERTGIAEGFGDDRLRLAALKSFTDGSLGARTAALRAPYADDPANCGLLLLSADDLAERIERGHRAGLRSAVHAIGDAAVEALLQAAERTSGAGPPPRIEHASVTDPEQAHRMGGLGMSAAVQPQFIESDFWTPQRLGPDRAPWAYPFRTLRDAGVTLAGSTDCPVERPDSAAVYRNFLRRADGNSSQALDAAAALHALTIGAETSLGEDAAESWAEGRPADFLVMCPGEAWPLDPDRPLPIERVIAGGITVAAAS